MSLNPLKRMGFVVFAVAWSFVFVGPAHARARAGRSPASMTTAETLRQRIPAFPIYQASSMTALGSSALASENPKLEWIGNLKSPWDMSVGQYAAPSRTRMPASVMQGLAFSDEP